MLPSFADEVAATILHPAKVKDSRNNDTLDYEHPTQTVAVLGWLNPATTTKVTGGGEVSLDGQTLFVPEGTPVTSVCAVEISGVLYLVDGDPRRWTSPTGALSHVQIPLARWTPADGEG